MITIEQHNGINVLRDDLLPGGTKSVLMPTIIGEADEYVYASPVYGGFQIALAIYLQSVGKKCTIFCAKRGHKHANTLTVMKHGGTVIEISPGGYQSVIEKRAADYCAKTGAVKLDFGSNNDASKYILQGRTHEILSQLGKEPDEIWCAVGSGTLVESILAATDTAQVHGVVVGMECNILHERLTLHRYHKPFDRPSSYVAPFQSMPNYDLKAWEYCNRMKKPNTDTFFWNVY